MDESPTRPTYDSVTEAEKDIMGRLSSFPEAENWLSGAIPKVVIPAWTDALTAFSANSKVSREEEVSLDQIESCYANVAEDFSKKAAVIRSGEMHSFDPSHLLFMVLFRELQNEMVGKSNMNPHKLRVLIDGRYTVE